MTSALPFSTLAGKLPENEMEQIIQKLIVNRSGDISKIEELLNLKMQQDTLTSNAFFTVYTWHSEKSEFPFRGIELRLPVPDSEATKESLVIFEMPDDNRYTQDYVKEHFGDSIQIVPPRPGQLDDQTVYYRINGKNNILSFGFSNKNNYSSNIVLRYTIESKVLH
ncbi:MAG TPA: hypothetical protein PLU53_15850 [Bacteroidia bacterium]|nr:hypothetical protein [Bacteroidia bacterium]